MIAAYGEIRKKTIAEAFLNEAFKKSWGKNLTDDEVSAAKLTYDYLKQNKGEEASLVAHTKVAVLDMLFAARSSLIN